MADVVASADLGQGFSSLPSRQGFEHFMAAELELPTKAYPSGLRSLSAFVGSRTDQLPLEFSKAAKHGQHQPAVRGCGVGPRISQRSETRASLPHRIEDVEEVPG